MFPRGSFDPKKVGRRRDSSPLGENQLADEDGTLVHPLSSEPEGKSRKFLLLEHGVHCWGDCLGPTWEESVGIYPSAPCWHQAAAKSGLVSRLAGWTDTPEVPSLPTPSDPSKGQLGPGVLGHGVRTSPESQRWGDLGSHQGLHVEDEETDGQGGEVTPSPTARW